MGLMVAFGCLGYLMKKYDYPVVAMLLGIIFGKMFETNLMRAWRIGFGEIEFFFQSMIAQVLWVMFFRTFVATPLIRYIKKKRRGGAAEH
jgi:putative tricarboxylic transport membrane protein